MAKATNKKFLRSLKKGQKVYISNWDNGWLPPEGSGLCRVETEAGIVYENEIRVITPEGLYMWYPSSCVVGTICLWPSKRQNKKEK